MYAPKTCSRKEKALSGFSENKRIIFAAQNPIHIKSKQSLYSWVVLLSLVLTWGSSFILIKRGLIAYPPEVVGALRIVITFMVLSPVIIFRFKKISKKEWTRIIPVGIIGSSAPAFLFAVAQTHIDSYLAGILNSMTPLFTLIMGVAFFRFRTSLTNVTGVLMGLAGATGLIYFSNEGHININILFAGLVIIATICYAFNANYIRYYLPEMNTVLLTAASFFVAGIPVTIYLIFFTGFTGILVSHPYALQSLGYIAILAVLGTSVALIFFNRLIQVTSPVFASSVTYLIPLVALFWGITDGEPFRLSYLIWTGFIIIGVFLVNQRVSTNRKI